MAIIMAINNNLLINENKLIMAMFMANFARAKSELAPYNSLWNKGKIDGMVQYPYPALSFKGKFN